MNNNIKKIMSSIKISYTNESQESLGKNINNLEGGFRLMENNAINNNVIEYKTTNKDNETDFYSIYNLFEAKKKDEKVILKIIDKEALQKEDDFYFHIERIEKEKEIADMKKIMDENIAKYERLTKELEEQYNKKNKELEDKMKKISKI